MPDEVQPAEYKVGIIGAGFGGLIAALELKRMGQESFVVLDRGAEVGGVWRDNHYPGCACDIPSHLYCIETQPNPEWSHSYASQPEILQYLKGVARNNDLERHLRLRTPVEEIRFDEASARWEVFSCGSLIARVQSIILALGPQSRPLIPDLPGCASFAGHAFHSSAWDHNCDLRGKKVAVVGTGASSIQIIPNTAPLAAEVVLFQRTAAWVLPRGDRRITSVESSLFRSLPFTQRLARAYIYWLMEFIGLAFVGNSLLHWCLTQVALTKLRREVKDPETRKRLTPDYKIGCKRILVSDDYYPAFNRPNVKLVTDAITEVTPQGIRTADRIERPFDCIVWGTGFVVADTDNYLRVVGRKGRVLTGDWRDHGVEAFRGIHVEGYPNLSFLLGPNSGLGHSSAVHVMESQVTYIAQYLAELWKGGERSALDVKADVQRRYNERIRRLFPGTIWASGCHSWYLTRAGENTTLYPGLTARYRRETKTFRADDYASI
jgi:cation diffusion facilitator CzcD-associated flavoprotein CzcO